MGQPIRVPDLKRGDWVLLFGQVVDIADVAASTPFPRTRLLQIRPADLPDTDPTPTLLPDDMTLVGLRLPRRYQVPCLLCSKTVTGEIDLAEHGIPRKALCGPCSDAGGPDGGRQILLTER